ncbi:MAG: inorganic phosphate transporter [Elusimicrobia bacterium]|nr:inorganic phosphate transporter [Elusimicrobiota bacterium]
MIALAVAAALTFAFLNGVIDAGPLAGSVISSRALSPRKALLIAALGSFLGSLLLGSAVVRTMGQGLLVFSALPPGTEPVTASAAAALAALAWVTLGAVAGLPSSFTHALLGGWFGAFVALGGFAAVRWGQAALVLFGVLAVPLLGLAAAWAALRAFYSLGARLSSRSQAFIVDLETLIFSALTVTHGANAAQKSMALLAVGALDLSAGVPKGLEVAGWMRVICAAAFSIGTLLGATRTLKTVGFRICRVGTVQSFLALSVSAALVSASTLVGLPLSPGQLNSACLLGVGAGHNPKTVRWGVAVDLLTNWVLTFPAAAVLGFGLAKVLA